MKAILFVCLGNICRSPLAEGVFAAKAKEAGLDTVVDSAGCGGWHAGEPPDRRSIACAAGHGLDISGQNARQVTLADFDNFDLILGLDRDNVKHLKAMKPTDSRARVALFLDEALGVVKDVPDPYYGGVHDFEGVYALCEKASASMIKKLASV